MTIPIIKIFAKPGFATMSNQLSIKSTSVVEWADDEVTDQTLSLNGEEVKSTVFIGSPRVQKANWSLQKDTLTIHFSVTFRFGERPVEIKSEEVWHLEYRGKELVIIQTADGFGGRGPRRSTLVYRKQ